MTAFKRTLFFLLIITLVFSCNNNRQNPEPAAPDTPIKINNREILNPDERKNTYADVDVSPMDMSYFPTNYPQFKMTNPEIGPPVMRVIYSRPHLQGRQLFPGIIKYGEMWRLGANEATELEVFKTVTVNNYKLSPGRYTLHCIPEENQWTIIINSAVDIWGLQHDASKDLVKVPVPITRSNPTLEYFTMVFEKTDNGADLIMAWSDVVAKLPFKF